MKHNFVKTKDALRILNLNSRQNLHYYVKKKWLTAKKIERVNHYNIKDILKLKEYLDGPV